MEDNIVIRAANITDIGTVSKFNIKLFEFEAGFVPNYVTTWTMSEAGQSYFTRRLTEETGIALIAEHNFQPIGYILGYTFKHLARKKQYMAEVENIFVEAEWRGHAVGDKLMQAFTSAALVKGVESLKVMALYENKRAHEFYTKQGFAPHAITFEKDIV